MYIQEKPERKEEEEVEIGIHKTLLHQKNIGW
jgi:hypothetical protein